MTSLLTMATLIALAGILSVLVVRSRNWLMAVCAAGAWAVLIAYIVVNPPGNMVAGDTSHQMLVIVLSGVAIAMLIVGIQHGRSKEPEGEYEGEPSGENRNKRRDYTEVVRENRNRRHKADTHFAESPEEYQARIHLMLHPKRRR